MIEINCAVCKSSTATTELYPANFNESVFNKDIFSARRLPDKIHYRIVRCNVCGLIFSNPILEPEKIKQLYRESELNYDDQIPFLKKTYGHYLKQAMKLAPSLESLLEVGCGNGFLLETAKELGFKTVFGVEPGIASVSKAKSDIKNSIHAGFLEINTYESNSFDVVCFFQTFDHLSNPNEVLMICHRILKPNGIVLGVNHNTDHPFARLLGEKSPIIDIEHIYLYNPSTFQKVFKNNNYEIKRIFNVKNAYPLSYWLYLFPLPFKQKVIPKLPSMLQNIILKFNPGNMGIVAQKI